MFNRDTNDACVTKNSLILLQNMRSLRRIFDEFNVYLNTMELKPDLICITEIWLSEQNSCEMFELDGYHPLLVASRKKRGGGVGLYVKETFCYRVEKKLTTNNLHIISVSVQLKKSKLLISCVYIPPNATTFETFEILDQYLDELVVPPETHQIICGDFNVNMIQNGIKQKRLRNLMNGKNLDIPKLLTPTRETVPSNSCLDIFFSNIPLKIKVDQSDISDHHTVLATFNTNFNDNCKESNTFTRNWKALENENVLKEAQYFLGEKL